MQPDQEIQKDRWPARVVIYANGNLADRSVFEDVEYVDPPEETYVPLSELEAAEKALKEAEGIVRHHLGRALEEHGVNEMAGRIHCVLNTLAAQNDKENPNG